MTTRPAPPLPQPQQPAAAARALAEAAQAAAAAWARPLSPAAHGRAVSQMHSVLRDLGIASRGLAAYQVTDAASVTQPGDFRRHVDSGSRCLLSSWECLDGVLAAEGIPPSADPDEPGAILCRAARDAILAWRQSQGTAADRDSTVRWLITATGFLSSAVLGLGACAPRRLVTDLETARTHLAEAAGSLSAVLQSAGDAPAPGSADGAR